MPSRQVLDVLPLPSSPEVVALPLAASPSFVGYRSSSSRSSHRTLILSLALGGGGVCTLLALVLVVVIAYLRLRASRTTPCDATSVKLRKFSYKVLKAATSGFSDVQKLGQGGFGSVYKGVLCDGTEIAVKKLDASSLQGEQEFRNEVSTIGCVNSPHIVNLLGFCAEGKHRLLVYTFMANGSLQEALFDEDCLGDLDWDKRFKIILDTARGLSFLHFMCKPPIIHGDVKPSNILLDSSFRARIADFGLSRLKSELQTPDASNEEAIRESIERERIRYERVARERARRQRRREQEETEMKKLENEQAMAISNTTASPGEQQQLSDAEQAAMSPQAGFSNLAHGEAAAGSGDVQKPTLAARESGIAGEEVRLDVESENFESADDGEDGDKSIATSKDGSPTEVKTVAAATSGTEEGEGEGWSTISTSQPDLDISIESCSKETHLLATKPTKEKGERRSWSRRDWWWKQESSSSIGEISMREHIFDWRVGEESMKKASKSKEKSAVNNKEQQQEQLQGDKKSDEFCAHEEQGFGIEKQHREEGRKDSRRHRAKNSIEWLGNIIGEEEDNTKKQLKKKKKKKKTELKGREWWREEYCDELSSKSRELLPNKKGKFWKDVDSLVDEFGVKSNELSQQGRNKSQGEALSGEVSQSKRLKARCDGSISRHRSRSRDWWSGEISGRGICSTPSMRGTICYVAPEYGGGGMLSEKSDVYSFGVLLLVIVSGRRPLQMNASSPFTEFERANLISWARSLAQSGNVLDLVDPALQGIFSADEASLCIILALLCLQRLPATRPNMEEIVKILSGVTDVPALPLELSPSPPGGFPFKSCRKPSPEMVNIDASLLP